MYFSRPGQNGNVVRSVSPLNLDLVPFGLMLAGLVVFYNLRRHNILDLLPIARAKLFEHIQDSVLVLDSQNILVDMNKAASDFLGVDRSFFGQKADPLFAIFDRGLGHLGRLGHSEHSGHSEQQHGGNTSGCLSSLWAVHCQPSLQETYKEVDDLMYRHKETRKRYLHRPIAYIKNRGKTPFFPLLYRSGI